MLRLVTFRSVIVIASLVAITACGPATAVDGEEPTTTNQLASEHEHPMPVPLAAAPAQAPAEHGAHTTAGGSHAGHQQLGAAEALPGRSLYHLDSTWTDHRGEEVRLSDFRGKPTVVVMFYASCDTACPLLVRDALRLEQELPAAARDETQFLLVTIDPERDAPERLARYVEENDLEAANWNFLTGPESQTRALAALLGVQYRPAGNGMFSHTNLVTILDREGVVELRTEGLNQPVGPAVEAIGEMLGNG